MLILSNDDAEKLLTMGDCIEALEQVYRDIAEGRAANAVRSDAVTTTSRADTVYSLKMMGGVVQSTGVGVVRINSDILSFANKRQVKLPLAPGNRYTGLVLLFSIETSEPLAIFPDGILQRMRVGATSALAARYLDALETRLKTLGLQCKVLMMLSNGGLTHLQQARARPIAGGRSKMTVRSGCNVP